MPAKKKPATVINSDYEEEEQAPKTKRPSSVTINLEEYERLKLLARTGTPATVSAPRDNEHKIKLGELSGESATAVHYWLTKSERTLTCQSPPVPRHLWVGKLLAAIPSNLAKVQMILCKMFPIGLNRDLSYEQFKTELLNSLLPHGIPAYVADKLSKSEAMDEEANFSDIARERLALISFAADGQQVPDGVGKVLFLQGFRHQARTKLAGAVGVSLREATLAQLETACDNLGNKTSGRPAKEPKATGDNNNNKRERDSADVTDRQHRRGKYRKWKKKGDPNKDQGKGK